MKRHVMVSAIRTGTATLLAVLILSVIALADVVKSGSFQASSDGVDVTLAWITENEANVARFEIERRTGLDDSFLLLTTVAAKGASAYQYVDNSAFKKFSTLYQYRIKVVYTNGSNPTYVGPVTITHSVSGVRRTWGSIKAMFR